MKRNLLIIAGFIIFGVLLGIWSNWYDQRYDTPLFIDMPGFFLGMILGIKVLTSVLAWGIIGTALALLLKPKVITWIMGIYVVIFGGVTLAFSWL